ncbi:MAG TPA: sulfite exporter TauE/SafE family protein, partial [Piscirickettsiaceae bacterium]|nr:sulfite exporter TauE/SafE family protein [Piscirickettsiaceae bacterium]
MMIYLATGAVVGVLAGLFGVGGGLLVVPVLTTVFAWTLGEAPYLVHLAIGTSLATILLTSLASVRAHHHHGAVDWALVRQLAGGMFVGAFLGGWS